MKNRAQAKVMDGAEIQDGFHYALLAAGGSIGGYESTFATDRMTVAAQRQALIRAKKIAEANGINVNLGDTARKADIVEQGRWVAALIFAAAAEQSIDAHTGNRMPCPWYWNKLTKESKL